MGLPERLVDRQLAKAKGDEPARMDALRLIQNVLLAGVVLGLFASGLNLYCNFHSPFWVALFLLWLVMGYVILRQRRYMKRR